MYSLLIRGRAVKWPSICPCCCREPDTTIEIKRTAEDTTFNWLTGSKTTRSETRSWEVPYCRQCLEHVQAERELQGFSGLAYHPVWTVIPVAAIFVGVAALAVATLETPIFRYLIPVLLLLIAVLVSRVTYRGCARVFQEQLLTDNARRAALQARADANHSPTCTAKGRVAVRFEGWSEKSHYGEWHDEWHHFSFANADYGELVAALNGEACKRA